MFRFAIRDLLWLTVVVALVVGWWTDRQRLYRAVQNSRHAEAVAERHLNEYRRAYIELVRAVERDGFTIASSNGTTYIVDSNQAARTIPSGEENQAQNGKRSPLPNP